MERSARQTAIILILVMMSGLFLANTIHAQQLTVRGTVTNASTSKVLPGVNILVKSTANGTATNLKGKYTLQVPSVKDTLVFSYVGFKNKIVPIRGRQTIDVELTPTTLTGKEMTVVAYGQQSTQNVTGSISSVSNEDITKAPAANIGNALTGKLEGVQTIQTSGLPGGDTPDIFVRGVASLNEGRSQPIYVLDGVIVRDASSITNLDPNNIESISVLKDASSLAVYGVEGANGAIVVKTKRGTQGPMNISIRTSAGLQVPTHILEIANSYDTARMYNLSQINDGTDPNNVRFTDKALKAFKTHSNPIIYPDVNFRDYITNPTAFQTRNNITLSGGTDDVRFLVAGGYLRQKGIIKTFDTDYDFNPSFNRYNLRSNLDVDVSPSTTVSLTANGRIEERTRLNINGGYLSDWAQIYRAVPYAGPGLVDGKLVQSGPTYIPGQKQGIMEQFYHSGYTRRNHDVLNLHLSGTQELDALTQGLSFSLKGAYNIYFTQIRDRPQDVATYEPYYRTDVDPSAAGDSSIVYKKTGLDSNLGYNQSYGKDRDWYLEGRLEYNRDFGPHSIKGLLLYNQRQTYYPASYRGIPRDLVSTVARVNYNFKSRYLLEFSMGYNGSENFAKGRRFGFFPAVSGGWILTNEPYFPDISFLSFLKLRASYGITGNDSGIGRFLYLPGEYNQNAGGYNFGYDNPSNSPGASEGALGNPLVTWEKSRKRDFGLNANLFNDKIEIKFDYFKEIRSDILTSRNTIPGIVAANLPALNLGKVQNEGYEAKLTWNQNFKNFLVRLGGNVSYAKSKILEMDEVQRNEPYQRRTGRPVGQPFGYVFDGFYTQEQVDNLGDGIPDPGFAAHPGDLKFKDLNGDGIIDGADQAAVGYSRVPEYTFGVHIDFGYKSLRLSTDWAGATNVSRQLNYVPTRTPFGPRGGRTILQYQVDGHWTPEKGQDATYPRMSLVARGRRNKQFSDFWQRDASYIRLKDTQLTYDFGPQITQPLGIKNLQVYVSGYNLLTFTKLDILDPEISGGSFGLPYPLMKIYNFGINIDL